MTDRRLCHLQRYGQISDAKLAAGQRVDNFHARFIAQYFEKIRNCAEMFFFQHLLPYFFYRSGVVV